MCEKHNRYISYQIYYLYYNRVYIVFQVLILLKIFKILVIYKMFEIHIIPKTHIILLIPIVYEMLILFNIIKVHYIL